MLRLHQNKSYTDKFYNSKGLSHRKFRNIERIQTRKPELKNLFSGQGTHIFSVIFQ
jgi:hypothetical protein